MVQAVGNARDPKAGKRPKSQSPNASSGLSGSRTRGLCFPAGDVFSMKLFYFCCF